MICRGSLHIYLAQSLGMKTLILSSHVSVFRQPEKCMRMPFPISQAVLEQSVFSRENQIRGVSGQFPEIGVRAYNHHIHMKPPSYTHRDNELKPNEWSVHRDIFVPHLGNRVSVQRSADFMQKAKVHENPFLAFVCSL